MLAIYQEILRIAQAEFSDVATNTTYIGGTSSEFQTSCGLLSLMARLWTSGSLQMETMLFTGNGVAKPDRCIVGIMHHITPMSAPIRHTSTTAMS